MNNKLPQITLVYDRYKKASPTKKASVEMRISYNYKQRYISTGIMLYPNQWKNGNITNCPDILQISKILDKQLSDVRQVIFEMLEEGNLDICTIQERIIKKNQDTISFTEYCAKRAEIRMYGKTKDSQERYARFIRLFKNWGGIEKFEDIKESNIIAYDRYLASKGMKSYSKWNNYHRFLNSFIMDAIDDGYLSKNPYRWVNIEKDKSTTGIGKYLTFEEFKRLKTCELPTESLNKVRDVFVFQTYTCLSYADLRKFNTNDIQETKGMRVYIGSRIKTSQSYTIPILNEAWEILEKYNSKLPIISNVKYNVYLKAVAQFAKIDKPISSHWARHTGATLLLNKGIDMRIVSKICGHSSIKITEQVYAKLLDETVVDAIKKLK